MKIRLYEPSDLPQLERMHRKSGLPPACMPDPSNPLFFVKHVVEQDGRAALAGFLKLTCEPYLLVDHEVETPEWRWNSLQALEDTCMVAAWQHGLADMTCWLPPNKKNFSKRLESMGYIQSPWAAFSKVR